MLKIFYQWLFRFLGVRDLYQDIVEQDCFDDIHANIRRDLQSLLTSANEKNPFFKGKFTSFLDTHALASDKEFLDAYSKLPALTKQDYAEAGNAVMADPWNEKDPSELELQVRGKPLESIRRLRQGDYLMQMATGGSTSLPLVVQMTKHHMFSMLFTFFKCWYRMGWRPGERMLVFYPKNTYNIDDMVKFNPYSKMIGFRYHLFDRIDEATVRGLVEDINQYKPKLLLVFPSPMNMIAHTIRRHGLKLTHQPAMINVSGETFFDCQRKNIRDVFPNSKVEDSYGSVELGELAHETDGGGLEIFSKVAYVETEPNEAGQPEMVITRLQLTDFPFIRYKMKDIADVEFRRDAQGREKYVITKIEGKDSNFILSDRGERFYPSFFNSLVNDINERVDDVVIEIKVFERGQRELDVQFILRDSELQESVRSVTRELLQERMSSTMDYRVKFVDFIDHDYRRKYRVIERIGDIEFAGGMVGDRRKTEAISEVVAESEALQDQK
jgi:phenylacetate-coenzyme A ligase PaaK-like adenylate-forming protein